MILNKQDYVGRVKGLLSDSSKLKVASIKTGKEIRHMINVRNAYKEVLDELLRKGKISQQTYWKLDAIGCIPDVLYGLRTVHKSLVNGLPKMRPILSAIGTASYNLYKFLVPILICLVTGTCTIVNSFCYGLS